MSKDDLIAFIKLYATEHSAFAASWKEYQKKVEEKFEAAKKEEEECKAIKAYMDKCQEQLKLLTEDNDKTIGLNNELKDKVSELEKALAEANENPKTSPEKQNAELEEKQNQIVQLQEEISKKDDLIMNYEKKFEEFEEGSQDAFGKWKISEDKVTKLEKMIEKQKKEMEEIRKENENLALERASETNTFAQERAEFKKTASISEKIIAHLTKEKAALESKLSVLQDKADKAIKKTISKETQTESSAAASAEKEIHGETDAIGKIKAKLLQKEEELHTANNYAASLLQELKKMQDKFIQLQSRDSILDKLLDEKTKAGQQAEREKGALAQENAELKKRREMAATEITKLTQQITRRSSKPREAGRHLSEAVLCSSVSF